MSDTSNTTTNAEAAPSGLFPNGFNIGSWLSGIGTLHIPFGGSSVVGQAHGGDTINAWLGGRGATFILGVICFAGGIFSFTKNS